MMTSDVTDTDGTPDPRPIFDEKTRDIKLRLVQQTTQTVYPGFPHLIR